jgi:ABC-type amino acid transport substrate-binding protein
MSTPATITPGVLTLCCTSLDSGALFWTDPDGTRHGYEVEAAEAVAAAIGLEVSWIFRQWSDIQPSLHRNECDAIWCGCAITPERQRTMSFSDPYAIFNETVVTRPESTVTAADQLAGKKVLAIKGSTNLALAETFPGAVTVPFHGDTDDVLGDMLDMLRAGEVDAVVDDDVCFIEPDPTLRIAFTVETRNAWGAACRPAEPVLVKSLNEGLAAVDLAPVWDRWLGALPNPFR